MSLPNSGSDSSNFQKAQSDAINTVKIGAIVGGVLGGVSLLVIIVLVWWFIRRMNRREAAKSAAIRDAEARTAPHYYSGTNHTGYSPSPAPQMTSPQYSAHTYITTNHQQGGLAACEVDTAGQQDSRNARKTRGSLNFSKSIVVLIVFINIVLEDGDILKLHAQWISFREVTPFCLVK